MLEHTFPSREALRRLPVGLADVAVFLGALALIAIFLPGFLLVVATLPLWGALRGRPAVGAALRGVNAAVVGLLLAALYSPVWTSAIRWPADAALALVAFALLTLWSTPPWLVVAFTLVGGVLLTRI